MKNLLNDFIDLLYPVTCPGCGQAFAHGEVNLCLNCQLDLPLFRNEVIVENILGGRIPIESAAIYLKFIAGGQTQQLLHQLKYKGNKQLGIFLGESFMRSGEYATLFRNVDLIIPVPLHDVKMKQRGFNQSALIAEGIANVLNKPINTTGVQRIVASETQTRKSRAERWSNVDGIFTCQEGGFAGQHVLLVDDVITTGATMEACARAVHQSGATAVSFATLATTM